MPETVSPDRQRPFDRRSPFWIGLWGFVGVGVAYELLHALAAAGEVFTLLGVALLLTLGLNPVIELLGRVRLPRLAAVLVVVLLAGGVIALFVALALPPLSNEAHVLARNLPTYKRQIATGQGSVGRLAKHLHVNTYVSSSSSKKGGSGSSALPYLGTLLSAGKVLTEAVSAVVIIGVLTVYFMVSLPAMKRLWLRAFPQSRRAHRREHPPGRRLRARQRLDLGRSGGRDRRVAHHLRGPVPRAARAAGGPAGPGAGHRVDRRRAHRHLGGPVGEPDGGRRDRRVLRAVPLPRGPPADAPRHAAHRARVGRCEHHRHVAGGGAARDRRGVDRHTGGGHHPADPRGGDVPVPRPVVTKG